MSDNTVIYLHGFRSSPLSDKAQRLAERATERGRVCLCPQLPVSGKEAIALVSPLIEASSAPVTLVGSSLGGCYATWLGERYPAKVAALVLVNPAIVGKLKLERYLGTQTHFHSGETFEFTEQHIAELRALDVPQQAHPERTWLLLEKGDQTLNYRDALARYPLAKQTVLEDGNHSFSRWADYLDAVMDFAPLSPP
jgi:predicted esterase YcpF (UPF0227 family)